MRKVLPILTLLFCTALCGCVQDRYDAYPSPTSGDGSMTFTLNVRVPGTSTPQTRAALALADETALEELDLLVFEKDDTGEETFRYHASADPNSVESVDQKDPVHSKKSFKIKLKETEKGKTERLVLIANAATEVQAKVVEWEQKKDPVKLADALQELTFNTSQAWAGKALPMWGELEGQTITVDTQLGEIKLLRAVARVDVGGALPDADVSDDDLANYLEKGGLTNFKLKQIHIINARETSRLVPDNFVNAKVKKPSLVGTSGNVNHIYGGTDGVPGFVREIYMGEAAAGECTLLVEGAYSANGQSNDYWYRIDFITQKNQLLDILRNHRYRVNITAVYGPGYERADDALNAPASNLEYDVVEFDENDPNEIEYVDGYYLAVDRSEVTLYSRGNEAGQQLAVKTTYEHGFKIETDADWFEVTPEEVAAAGETVVTIKSLKQGAFNSGSFTIKAGKLSKTISVEQLDKTLLTLTLLLKEGEGEEARYIPVEQLTFPQSPKAAKEFVVRYSPNDAQLTCEEKNSDIAWERNQKFTDTGEITLLLLPKGSQELRSAQFVCTLTDGTESITKKLTVLQYNGDMQFSVLNKELTIAAGEVAHTFKIKSTDDWTLAGAAPAEDDEDVTDIQLAAWDDGIQNGGVIYKDYKVTFAANDTWRPRTWHFIPKSDNPDWPANYGAWEITQNGAEPTLTVTADKQDFGAGSAADEIAVTVTTDAKWGFESRDGKDAWTAVAGVVDKYGYGYPGGNDTENDDGHGTDNCGTPQKYEFSFPGVSYDPAVAGPIPAAGPTTVPLTFKTYTEGQAAKEKEQTLEFTRTVPGFFRSTVADSELEIDKTELEHTGGDVEVKFATNMAWKLTTSNNVASENSSGKAENYRTVTQIVKISTPLWNENYNNDKKTTQFVTITARPDGTPAEGEPAELTAQVEQKAYYLEKAEWADKSQIDETTGAVKMTADGKTPQIVVKGVYPELDVVLRKVGSPEYMSPDGEIPSTVLTDGGEWSKSVTMPDMELGWGDTVYDVLLKSHDEPKITIARIGKILVEGLGEPTIAAFKTDRNASWWGNTVALTVTRPSANIEWPKINIILKEKGAETNVGEQNYKEITKTTIEDAKIQSLPSDPTGKTGVIFVDQPLIARTYTKYEIYYKEPNSDKEVYRDSWTVTVPTGRIDPLSSSTMKIECFYPQNTETAMRCVMVTNNKHTLITGNYGYNDGQVWSFDMENGGRTGKSMLQAALGNDPNKPDIKPWDDYAALNPIKRTDVESFETFDAREMGMRINPVAQFMCGTHAFVGPIGKVCVRWDSSGRLNACTYTDYDGGGPYYYQLLRLKGTK